ncbi:MAG TPA: alanine racemase [Tepidisphaeraceae bacterium]|nr:alanine racemase [Tepidisphaeraceae bacterium]
MVTDQTTEIAATPALVIDLATVERNIDRLARYATEHDINVRPHTKTHKSLKMASRQLRAGAIGLTAAKVGEAEVMAAASRDILIAYPAADAHRCRRIAELARGGVTVRVAADSVEAIDALSSAARTADSTVGVLVDLDVGFHRTGAQSPAAALELARKVARDSSLRLDGIFFYPGHVWTPADEQAAELARIDALLAETINAFHRSGLDAGIVSGGSTPTAYQSHLVKSQTEIRPGTYLYNDMNTARAGFCSLDDCAAAIVCTVVSTSIPGKVVIDGGTKTFTSDRNVTAPDSGHGHLVEFPDAKLVRLSEEHGEVDVSACSVRPVIGQRVTVIPNHICPCVNLQDSVWLRHADGSFAVAGVDTRGRLS